MSALKLAQLPDRQPAKITITVNPELKKGLEDYAKLYAKTYGAAEEVSELIPYILDAFLKSDSSFRKGRKELQQEPEKEAVLSLPRASAFSRRRKSQDTANTEAEGS